MCKWCWGCVSIKRQRHPLSQCVAGVIISPPSRIDGNPLHCDLHGVLWLLVKHWLPLMIQLHEAVKKHVRFEEIWVFLRVVYRPVLPSSKFPLPLLPDSKHLHVVCFVPFVSRCQNIITAVLKWNKRIATLRITAQKQWPDGKVSPSSRPCCSPASRTASVQCPHAGSDLGPCCLTCELPIHHRGPNYCNDQPKDEHNCNH